MARKAPESSAIAATSDSGSPRAARADDGARLGFAAILLLPDEDGVFDWKPSVPRWARSVLAKALLQAPHDEGAIGLDSPVESSSDGGTYSRRAYAYATPDDLRRCDMLRDRLRTLWLADKETSPVPYDLGYRLLRACIFLSAPEEVLYNVYEGSNPDESFVGHVGDMWRPAMAPWALALAHSCGHLRPGHSPSCSGYAASPFGVLRRAVGLSPEIAHAMLDVSSGPFVADVDNSNGEPEFDFVPLPPDYNMGYSGTTLLNVLISTPGPDMSLFRRLVHRSSDATLNRPDSIGRTPLLSLYAYSLSGQGDSKEAIVLLQILLERADLDGGGVNLADFPWEAKGAVMLPRHVAACLPISLAYRRVITAQKAYRADLPSVLAAVLLQPSASDVSSRPDRAALLQPSASDVSSRSHRPPLLQPSASGVSSRPDRPPLLQPSASDVSSRPDRPPLLQPSASDVSSRSHRPPLLQPSASDVSSRPDRAALLPVRDLLPLILAFVLHPLPGPPTIELA
jgi:hypothetical protein